VLLEGRKQLRTLTEPKTLATDAGMSRRDARVVVRRRPRSEGRL